MPRAPCREQTWRHAGVSTPERPKAHLPLRATAKPRTSSMPSQSTGPVAVLGDSLVWLLAAHVCSDRLLAPALSVESSVEEPTRRRAWRVAPPMDWRDQLVRRSR